MDEIDDKTPTLEVNGSFGVQGTRDLIIAFRDELQRLDVDDVETELLTSVQAHLDSPTVNTFEEWMLFEELVSALNEFAPEGYYFGPAREAPWRYGIWEV